MNTVLTRSVLSTLSILVLASAATLRADEGMWLFNQLPAEHLASKYGFRPDDEWATHVMRSSVRISAGGSGSVVSSGGLVMTNHHVVSSCLHQLSTAERNHLEAGFFARTIADEVRCPNTHVDILWEIVDVTDRVEGAVRPEMDAGSAEAARRVERAAIEKESKDSPGYHSEVVTLYRGGKYHLYRYKRYDDVRMVFAPESAIAFFGGDADNFEFPRHCLDVSFVRLYDDGKPAEMDHWLRWSKNGVAAGDLTFVSGHPGRTQRLNTVDHLRYLRDVAYPSYLELLYRREIALQQFGLRGGERARVAKDDLFGIQNGRKALRGVLAGMQDPAILAAKLKEEAALKAYAASHPGCGAFLADWEAITASLVASRAYRAEYAFLEQGRALWSPLFGQARTIYRLVTEQTKPAADRLPEFRETALPAVKRRLYSPAPIDPDLEKAKLTDSLTWFAEKFGAEHPLVKLVLQGKPPADRAHELVSNSRLLDVAARKELVEGGVEAVESTDDAMIMLAKSLDPYARAARKRFEDLVTSVRTQSYSNISKAAFAATGTGVYPDATFTLRLAYGVVAGWEEGGRDIPAFTTIGGAYGLGKAHANKEPYALPETWRKAKPSRDVHFNFVSTADIIGGNSGSPVINRRGEVVGLIFDGNIHGLVLDIVYTEEKARAVSVDAQAIIEALQSVYGLDRLVRELGAR